MFAFERFFVIVLFFLSCNIDRDICCTETGEKSAAQSNDSNAAKNSAVKSTEASTDDEHHVISTETVKSLMELTKRRKEEDAAKALEALNLTSDGIFWVLKTEAQYKKYFVDGFAEFEILALIDTQNENWANVRRWIEEYEQDKYRMVSFFYMDMVKNTTLSSSVGITEAIGLVAYYNGQAVEVRNDVQYKQVVVNMLNDLINKRPYKVEEK